MRRRGYVIGLALMIVMIAMFLSTALLSRLESLHRSGVFLAGSAQERLTAHAAAAVVLDNLNQLGDLSSLSFPMSGQVEGLDYRAELVPDPDHSDIFHLTTQVGASRYHMVLRQEPEVQNLAYSRVRTTEDSFFSWDLLSGSWVPLPTPPSLGHTPEEWLTLESTSNLSGDYFIVREVPGVANVLLQHHKGSGWKELPTPGRAFGNALNDILAADESKLYAVGTEAVGVLDLETETWSEAPPPPAVIYNTEGDLVPIASVGPTMTRVAARDGRLLLALNYWVAPSAPPGAAAPEIMMESHSTFMLLEGGEWRVLPPLRTSSGYMARANSFAVGPKGAVMSTIADDGYKLLSVDADGWKQAPELPEPLRSQGGELFVDAEGRPWLFASGGPGAAGSTLYRGDPDTQDWSSQPLPPGENEEVEIGGFPDEAQSAFQATVGY
ncbi:MAG: hypothetical protein KC910_19560 [Candidatus Eremiobacteraeota bacterium]|nr:hypothetical protein [Candidatus Eremiobacteraeota bacterium]